MADTVTLIADVNNCQVVHVTGRRFPGIVVQGDSLQILVNLASEIVQLLKIKNLDEAIDTAEEMHSLLFERLQIYQRASAATQD